MTELVQALGWRAGWRGDAKLLTLIGAATLAALLLNFAIASAVGGSVVAAQIVTWLIWLAWLGAVFPRNATHDAAEPCELPYRRAFTREILVGIAVAFGQILRPALAGVAANDADLGGPTAYLVLGGALILVGLGTIALGVAALGVARTLFVFEYVRGGRAILTSGIYRVLRNPLFLGGTSVSVGLAISTADSTAIRLGVVNACVVPIYVWLEDRRCCTILGQAYVDYRAAVGGMMLRRRTAIRSSALRHKQPGRAGPITERSRVSRR